MSNALATGTVASTPSASAPPRLLSITTSTRTLPTRVAISHPATRARGGNASGHPSLLPLGVERTRPPRKHNQHKQQQQQQQRPVVGVGRAPRSSSMEAVQSPAGFPVASRCGRAAVGGRDTDLLVCDYQDALLLMASQTGTVGTVVLAKQDSTLDGKTTFSTSVLVGKRDEPLLLVAARQLVELAHSKGVTKPVICCLALSEHTSDGIRQLLAAVKDGGLL